MGVPTRTDRLQSPDGRSASGADRCRGADGAAGHRPGACIRVPGHHRQGSCQPLARDRFFHPPHLGTAGREHRSGTAAAPGLSGAGGRRLPGRLRRDQRRPCCSASFGRPQASILGVFLRCRRLCNPGNALRRVQLFWGTLCPLYQRFSGSWHHHNLRLCHLPGRRARSTSPSCYSPAWPSP